MRKVSQAIYDRIDNGVYNVQSDQWWQPESPWYQMIVTFDPARVGYAKKILIERLKIDPKATDALEVGCGGGFMTEEMARMGFTTTGVDPSEPSLRVAADHARASGLNIRYETGAGESLPFEDRSFGAVFCCDVLEHVRDLPKVISEISRVLKPGACFITTPSTARGPASWAPSRSARNGSGGPSSRRTSTYGGCSSSPEK